MAKNTAEVRSASSAEIPMTRPASAAFASRWITPGVDRPCTAKMPAMHMNPTAMSRVG